MSRSLNYKSEFCGVNLHKFELDVIIIKDHLSIGVQMSKQSFGEWLNSAMAERGWSQKELAERARVSFRAISDARSGRLEELLKKKDVGARKKIGVAGSTNRILLALGQDPKEWMGKLGLEVPKHKSSKKSFESQLNFILSEPLTSEDIEQFGRVQKELGELFSVEMALRLIMRKRFEL